MKNIAPKPQFAFEQSQMCDREILVSIEYCLKHNVQYGFYNTTSNIPKDAIPVGSVIFCESVLRKQIKPNYYPEFLNKFLFRKICNNNIKYPVFIKPADKFKRFTGKIINNAEPNLEPYICSEIVTFVDEWRYYINNGHVVSCGGYIGDNPSTPPSLPPINFPQNWCGSVDFGRLSTGEFALVEAHFPYALGWYGPSGDSEKYVEFLIAGWNYMLELKQ